MGQKFALEKEGGVEASGYGVVGAGARGGYQEKEGRFLLEEA